MLPFAVSRRQAPLGVAVSSAWSMLTRAIPPVGKRAGIVAPAPDLSEWCLVAPLPRD